MQPARVTVVSPDQGLAASLATTLRTVSAAVSVCHSPDALVGDALQVPLLVLHLDGSSASLAQALLARLEPGTQVIALLPRASLVAVVELMQASAHVAGMIVVEDLDTRHLASLAARILTGEMFGLVHLMTPGTTVHEIVVHDHQERVRCLGEVAAFLEGLGARKRVQTSIEQCLDEMLMNALYDAPVDTAGAQIFAGVSIRQRIRQRIDQAVVVQYGHDGARLALSVRDAYGGLERATVLRVLHKCLHAADKLDRKVGGAGVGLYLMVNASTELHFHVVPAIATEAICSFDLAAPAPRLRQFTFVSRPTDVTGRLASARLAPGTVVPVTVRTSSDRRRTLAVAGGAALSVALLALGVRALVADGPAPPGAPAPAAPGPPALTLDSRPTGARVSIAGRPLGETPVTITNLAPGTDVTVTFEREGHAPATATLRVPAPGARLEHVQPLTATGAVVRVRFVSTPSGARVVRLGGDSGSGSTRTYTPATLLVEAGHEHRFMLTMPDHVPLVLAPFTPSPGAADLEMGGPLTRGFNLHVEAPNPGAVTVGGAPHCAALAVPADCVLAPGTYPITLASPGQPPIKRTVTITDHDDALTL